MTMECDVGFLHQHLIQSGTLLRPGCTEAQIREFEERERVCLTALLRKLYGCFDGFEAGDGDDVFRLWSLEEVSAEPDYRLEYEGRC